MLLPGIKVNTSPTDHVPVEQMQFMRFIRQDLGAVRRVADGELSSASFRGASGFAQARAR